MSTLCDISKHAPCSLNGIVGCNCYSNTDSIICFIANGDNNFPNEGIVEKSILFVDSGGTFEAGKLNVFEQENHNPKFKISRTQLSDGRFIGRVVMCANQYK
ncbi:MAG: hypothetical protein GX862_11610 [Leucobacter sp.]|nr:hypothetical protein [Leucobacter sp.]